MFGVAGQTTLLTESHLTLTHPFHVLIVPISSEEEFLNLNCHCCAM